MDPEKFLNLQMQMRENNMEVADFLNDFTNWKETKPVKQKISDKKVERIKAYDYQAWDKFDVDKALAEDTDDGDNDNDNNNCTMDKTVGSPDHPTRNSSSETDEEQEDQRRLQLSKDARELGNVRFKVS
ncbi:unnamed protein product [Trichobilharzia regenti]|nr:unnamed protein product [Trichobilharzia regenti]